MDGLFTPALILLAVSLTPFVIFTVIRSVRTDLVWAYKHFKKPVQTTGIIDWVECIDIPQGECYYITTYTYTDNMGKQRTVTFKWHRRIGWPGDSIAVQFDSQDPEKCIANCQLEQGRKVWRITLITVLALVVFAGFGLLYYFSK